jgi:hypothetical protein
MSTDTSVDTGPMVAEIAGARNDMAVALEALADRLHPKKVLDRVKVRLAAKVEELKDRINPVQIVKRKLGSQPEPLPGSRVLTVRGSERGGSPAAELPAGQARTTG